VTWSPSDGGATGGGAGIGGTERRSHNYFSRALASRLRGEVLASSPARQDRCSLFMLSTLNDPRYFDDIAFDKATSSCCYCWYLGVDLMTFLLLYIIVAYCLVTSYSWECHNVTTK
jgi:hypothetical protein